jgi:hypothetical protein
VVHYNEAGKRTQAEDHFTDKSCAGTGLARTLKVYDKDKLARQEQFYSDAACAKDNIARMVTHYDAKGAKTKQELFDKKGKEIK